MAQPRRNRPGVSSVPKLEPQSLLAGKAELPHSVRALHARFGVNGWWASRELADSSRDAPRQNNGPWLSPNLPVAVNQRRSPTSRSPSPPQAVRPLSNASGYGRCRAAQSPPLGDASAQREAGGSAFLSSAGTARPGSAPARRPLGGAASAREPRSQQCSNPTQLRSARGSPPRRLSRVNDPVAWLLDDGHTTSRMPRDGERSMVIPSACHFSPTSLAATGPPRLATDARVENFSMNQLEKRGARFYRRIRLMNRLRQWRCSVPAHAWR